MARPKPNETNLLNAPAKSYVIPEPLGVSLIIAPGNYPFQLSLGPVVAAIAAGCTIVLKPSELTPNCSFRAFYHFKSILDKEVTPDPDVKYSPYTEEKLKLLTTIVGD